MTKEDVPFYEECKFGYYEWFVKKVGNEITICKIAMLAPFKRIRSDDSYKLDIEYLPELNDEDKFLDRNQAYEMVKKYWKENNIGYMKFII